MASPPKPPFGPSDYMSALMGTTSGYDWEKILQQWLDPYQKMYEEQMAAAQAAASQQQELAQSNAALDSRQMEILHKKALYDIKNSMSGRMLADSGEQHYQVNKENELYKIGMKKGANALRSYLENLSNTLAANRLAGLQGLQQQRLSLLGTLPSLYPPTMTTGPWWTKPASATGPQQGPMSPPGGWGWGG